MEELSDRGVDRVSLLQSGELDDAIKACEIAERYKQVPEPKRGITGFFRAKKPKPEEGAGKQEVQQPGTKKYSRSDFSDKVKESILKIAEEMGVPVSHTEIKGLVDEAVNLVAEERKNHEGGIIPADRYKKILSDKITAHKAGMALEQHITERIPGRVPEGKKVDTQEVKSYVLKSLEEKGVTGIPLGEEVDPNLITTQLDAGIEEYLRDHAKPKSSKKPSSIPSSAFKKPGKKPSKPSNDKTLTKKVRDFFSNAVSSRYAKPIGISAAAVLGIIVLYTVISLASGRKDYNKISELINNDVAATYQTKADSEKQAEALKTELGGKLDGYKEDTKKQVQAAVAPIAQAQKDAEEKADKRYGEQNEKLDKLADEAKQQKTQLDNLAQNQTTNQQEMQTYSKTINKGLRNIETAQTTTQSGIEKIREEQDWFMTRLTGILGSDFPEAGESEKQIEERLEKLGSEIKSTLEKISQYKGKIAELDKQIAESPDNGELKEEKEEYVKLLNEARKYRTECHGEHFKLRGELSRRNSVTKTDLEKAVKKAVEDEDRKRKKEQREIEEQSGLFTNWTLSFSQAGSDVTVRYSPTDKAEFSLTDNLFNVGGKVGYRSLHLTFDFKSILGEMEGKDGLEGERNNYTLTLGAGGSYALSENNTNILSWSGRFLFRDYNTETTGIPGGFVNEQDGAQEGYLIEFGMKRMKNRTAWRAFFEKAKGETDSTTTNSTLGTTYQTSNDTQTLTWGAGIETALLRFDMSKKSEGAVGIGVEYTNTTGEYGDNTQRIHSIMPYVRITLFDNGKKPDGGFNVIAGLKWTKTDNKGYPDENPDNPGIFVGGGVGF